MAALAALATTGCQKAYEQSPAGGGARGRYVGVGIYMAGQMWSQLARPQSAQDAGVATLQDDEQILVVLDSATGELRQCGNFSGHCIALNPWAKAASTQGAPAKLRKHAQDLAREAAGEAARTTRSTPTAPP